MVWAERYRRIARPHRFATAFGSTRQVLVTELSRGEHNGRQPGWRPYDPTMKVSARTPHEVALSGSTKNLCEQFVLSRTHDTPEGFETDRLGRWRLAHHPTLPVITIRARGTGGSDIDGGQLGWLLGYPVAAEGTLLQTGSTVTADDDPVAFVESLGGRFLAAFVNCPNPAIYPDAAATYSSVFCGSLEVAASTSGLIPYDETTRDRLELVEQLGIPLTNSMYPLGLTPRHGVRILLPNHHLDLTTWTMVRHGPTWRERGSIGVEESVSRVAAIVRRNIAAVMDVHPTYLQLTAGNDSRMLLACARQRRSELATYTMKLPDLSGMNDAKVAAQVSKRVGVSHRSVPMLRPDPADLEMWMYRISCGVGEPRGFQADTAYRSLDRTRTHMAGNIGDLARIGYWGTVAGSATPATMEQLVAHAVAHRSWPLDPGQQRGAASPAVLEEVERWRNEVTVPDPLSILDLLFVENRLGCWAGIWPYAQYYGPGFTFFPMCHREVIDLMMFLPEAVRRGGEFNQMVIRQEWPELLDVPFNSPSRTVRAAHLPRRIAGGVRRRARRRLGR